MAKLTLFAIIYLLARISFITPLEIPFATSKDISDVSSTIDKSVEKYVQRNFNAFKSRILTFKPIAGLAKLWCVDGTEPPSAASTTSTEPPSAGSTTSTVSTAPSPSPIEETTNGTEPPSAASTTSTEPPSAASTTSTVSTAPSPSPIEETTSFTVEYELEIDGDERLLDKQDTKRTFEAALKNLLNVVSDETTSFYQVLVETDSLKAKKKYKLTGNGKCKGKKCNLDPNVKFPNGRSLVLDQRKRLLSDAYFEELKRTQYELADMNYNLKSDVKVRSVEYESTFEQKVDQPWSSLNQISLDTKGKPVEIPSEQCKGRSDECNQQRKAITSVFETLGLDPDSAHECSWVGVECNGSDIITRIRIENNNTTEKKFPHQCTDLPYLEELILRNNNIVGTIPKSIGMLKNIQIMSFDKNNLFYTIPTEIGHLEKLTELRMSQNYFIGSLPSEVTKLKQLQILDISRNENMGWSIPTEFGNLGTLKTIIAYKSGLFATVPDTFGSLSQLEELFLADNNIGGEISAFLKLSKLKVLHLANNEFTGTLSDKILDLKDLCVLNLYRNQMKGPLPAFGSANVLSSLTEITLGKNDFSGILQPHISYLEHLIVLDLADNDIALNIPSSLGDLENLTILNLHGNELSWELPTELGSLTALDKLVLSGNKFEGSIPAEFGNFTSLKFMDVGHNKLSGSIPATFNDLSDIEALFIWNNMFEGNIKFLCDRNITSFGYDEGELEGCVRTQKSVIVEFFKDLGQRYSPTLRECEWKPYIVCNNKNMITEIKLSGEKMKDPRKLSGSLSSVIGELDKLEVLDVSKNKLKGTVPSEISNLQHLKKVDLSSNDLKGNAPFLCNVSYVLLIDNNEINTCDVKDTSSPTSSPTFVPSSSPTATELALFIVETSYLTWDEHEQRARDNGYWLASVHSEEENSEIYDLVKGRYDVFLGGKRDDSNNENWIWTDESAFKYTSWYPGEPNNWGSEGEGCIELWNWDSRWNDVGCNAKRFAVYRTSKYELKTSSPSVSSAPTVATVSPAPTSYKTSPPTSELVRYRIANLGVTSWRPTVAQFFLFDSFGWALETGAGTLICSGSHTADKACENAVTSTYPYWRPQCNECKQHEAWIGYELSRDVEVVGGFASGLGVGDGGGMSWEGGVVLQKSDDGGRTWKDLAKQKGEDYALFFDFEYYYYYDDYDDYDDFDNSNVLCPGQSPYDYCDCTGDCSANPEWCACSDAQACCSDYSGSKYKDVRQDDYDPSL